MIIHFFSIYDKKAEAFTNGCFQADFPGQALRAFNDMINSTDNDLGKHPEDYALFHIGTFNKENGLFTTAVLGPDNEPVGAKHVADGLTVLNRTLDGTKPGPGHTDRFGGPK